MGFEAAAAVISDAVVSEGAAAIADTAVADLTSSALATTVVDATTGALVDVGTGALVDAGTGLAIDATGAAVDAVANSTMETTLDTAINEAANLNAADAMSTAQNALQLTDSQVAQLTGQGWSASDILSAAKAGGSALKALGAIVGPIAGLAGTKYAADAAGQAAATQAQAAAAAAKVLAPAATQAANVQAGAATQSANTLASGYTAAGAQQVAGQQAALGVANSTLAQQTANQQPYMQAGTQALQTLSAGLLPGGQFNRGFTMADAQNMPAYQFALQQGEQAIGDHAATGGTQLSSANLQSLNTFAQGTAAQYEQQAFSQWLAQNNLTLGALQQMVQTGQTSTQQLQAALAQYGVSAETINQNIGSANANATMGAAQSTAAGQVGAANATAGGITNAANATAAGLIGVGNATSAGTTAKANIVNSGASTVGNQLYTMASAPPQINYYSNSPIPVVNTTVQQQPAPT